MAEQLLALSPLDGRYLAKTTDLREFFSESALIRYRIEVEIEYLLALDSKLGLVEDQSDFESASGLGEMEVRSLKPRKPIKVEYVEDLVSAIRKAGGKFKFVDFSGNPIFRKNISHQEIMELMK